jgi:nucleoside 2-deoxyribosyltransferase
MQEHPLTVYCAGPLFNAKERDEMAELASGLETAGLQTFLPQRDGLELTACVSELARTGVGPEAATDIVSRAIFALDAYQVVEACDAIIVNLNGRVPDEGAVSEAAMAWRSGKVVVGYKADGRSVFLGGDNPLVAGLFDFCIHARIEDAVEGVVDALASKTASPREILRGNGLPQCVASGRRLWDMLSRDRATDRIVTLLKHEWGQAGASTASA